MDTSDPFDARAVAIFGTEAGIPDMAEAARVLGASDAGMRDHYRRAARAEASPFVHADAHFRMGTGHEAEGSPCQDWATSGVTAAGLPFAVVADGCSTSGRTDLGARVLALSAARALGVAGTTGGMAGLRRRVLDRAMEAGVVLGLRPGDMDATLAVAVAAPGGGARAFLFGDGLVALRTRDALDVRSIDWAGNMPGYPWYLLSPTMTDRFVQQSRAFAAEAGRACCTVTRTLIGEGGAVLETESLGLDAGEALEGIEFDWTTGAQIDSLSVLTDGAAQFSGAGWTRVVSDLTAFRAARSGEFVRRRMSRALASLAKAGSRPVDDVAVAAIATDGGDDA